MPRVECFSAILSPRDGQNINVSKQSKPLSPMNQSRSKYTNDLKEDNKMMTRELIQLQQVNHTLMDKI